MADAFLTLADLAKVNDQNNADYGISDLLDEAPLLRRLAAEPTDGDTHKYLKQTGAPTVGFRSVNDGRENAASSDTEVTVTLKLLDCSFVVDKAIADQYRFGAEAYIAREAQRHIRAGFFEAEEQVIYGTGNAAAGFAGLADNSGLDALADEMVIGHGGVAVDVQSSVWGIRTGNDLRDAVLVTGMDGNIEIGESVTQMIDGATGRYPVYATPIFAWLGMQIGGARSVGRLCNVDATATLDDDGISDLLSLFPAGRGPNLLVMNRTSLKQLQQSRTATNATGAPSPFPTESFGVPIIVTDAITSTEAVIA
jgi:hypothetical protein